MKIINSILSLLAFSHFLLGAPAPLPKGVYSYEPRYKDHPGDYPYPTDMTFSLFCDHKITFLIDSFDPDVVKEGDTVFVLDWYLNWFVENVHPHIKRPYILVCNDTDGWHPDPGVVRKLLYDPKLAAWFCKNLIFSRHPKLFQIPIGPNIIYWDAFHHHLEIPYFTKLIEHVKHPKFEKNHLILLNITVRNDGHRDLIHGLFKDKDWVHFRPSGLGRIEAWDEIAHSKFVFCPPGIGFDLVRYWEAELLDTIPVMVHSPLDDLYAKTPIVYVDEWGEVNPQFLHQKYEEIELKKKSGEYRSEQLYFDHWGEKISSVQQQVRAHQWKGSDLAATTWSSDDMQDLQSLLQRARSGNANALLIYGDLTSMRPIQISNKCRFLDQIFLIDRYQLETGERHASALANYCTDRSLFERAHCVKAVNKRDFHSILRREETHVLMDLSYYRFEFRKDLELFYERLVSGKLICGNQFHDEYVKHEIERFARPRGLTIKSQGDFWFFIKS